MPINTATYRVLIASPSDLARERQVMREVMHEWNEQHSTEYGVSFQPVMWEFAAIPEMGDRPQAILNRQLGDSDMLIGAFWTRIGTPTGVDISGTVEEISRFRSEGKSVLLYFSNRPIPPNKIDRDQHAQVQLFHILCNKEGLTQDFGSVDALREHLERHLTGLARRIKAQADAHRFDAIAGQLKMVATKDDLAASLEELKELVRARKRRGRRSEQEITSSIDEIWDKIWYNRHLNFRYSVEMKGEKVDPSVWKIALEAGERVRQKYRGREDELGPWSDFEWGMLNGKLSALRWVLGEEWDFLDT